MNKQVSMGSPQRRRRPLRFSGSLGPRPQPFLLLPAAGAPGEASRGARSSRGASPGEKDALGSPSWNST